MSVERCEEIRMDRGTDERDGVLAQLQYYVVRWYGTWYHTIPYHTIPWSITLSVIRRQGWQPLLNTLPKFNEDGLSRSIWSSAYYQCI
eukprot:scaffold32374_cov214-Amphora_coffeaeformis.AAC.1